MSTTIAVQKSSVLSRINPLLKIALCFMTIMGAVLLRHSGSLGCLVGVLLFLIVAWVKVSLKTWLYGMGSILVLMGLSTLFLGNLSSAIFGALRLLAILLPTPLLASTTPPADLIRALRSVKLPVFLTLSVMLIWRFVPVIYQETQRILEANQLRGVNLTQQPQQWFPGLFVPLVFQIVIYADEVTIGLQTRGYDPELPRSNSCPLVWHWQDTIFGLGFLGMVVIIGLIEWTL